MEEEQRVKTQDVKDAVRRRYPASPAGPTQGAWCVVEEWENIDVLAFCAWRRADPARSSKARPIIGHEVKVSRSDYRRELRRPSKRAAAVAHCTEFYFVTPAGMLSEEEKLYIEPEEFKDHTAFERKRCPASCQKMWAEDRRMTKEQRTGEWQPVPVAWGDRVCDLHHGDTGIYSDNARGYSLEDGREIHKWEKHDSAHYPHRGLRRWIVCAECKGKGYVELSAAEKANAPTLWIPADVGLIEVNARGCSLILNSPINHEPDRSWDIGKLARYVSMRPDPRHHPNG